MTGNFDRLKIEIYGASHSEYIGVKLFGLPSGYAVCEDGIKKMLLRRSAKDDVISTPRHETDGFVIVSGLKEGFTTGGVFEAKIRNEDIRPEDYENVRTVPRPSHADYAAYLRDGAIPTGGGRFSGRMTAPLCIAGAVAESVLKTAGISLRCAVKSIGGIDVCAETALDVRDSDLKTLDNDKKGSLERLLSDVAEHGDSIGGVVECVCDGVPAGALGDGMFEGLESKISYAVYGVPAVKGVEFGDGFILSEMRGSGANDAFCFKDGKVVTVTNRSGGINGGINNGMPVVVRAAIRPTPSIGLCQDSVDLSAGKNAKLEIKGRHDVCIVPRAVPCVESAVAVAVLDEALKRGLIGCVTDGIDGLRQKIDGIDDEISELLKKRLAFVKQVAVSKKNSCRRVLDKEREDGIVDRITIGANCEEKEFISRVYREAFEASRDLQNKIVATHENKD